MNRLPAVTLGMWALVGLACERADLTGPPTLRLGRDECAECGMPINEDRCASGMLVVREGRRDHIHFDDLGCMLDFERHGGGGVTVLERFARDYTARTWISAERATFLFTDQ